MQRYVSSNEVLAIIWNGLKLWWGRKVIFGMLRGLNILNKVYAQDYLRQEKQNVVTDKYSWLQHIFASLYFSIHAFFPGLNITLLFYEKLRKNWVITKKVKVFHEIKCITEVPIDMIQRLTFEHADRLHIFSSKKSVFENKVQRNLKALNILPFLYVL